MKLEDFIRSIKEEIWLKYDRLRGNFYSLNYDKIIQDIAYHPFVFSAIIAGSFFVGYRGVRNYNTVADIPVGLFRRKRKIYGHVVLANDADGLRVRHVPYIYRWLGIKSMYNRNEALSMNTLNIRLAGIDSPEGSHFGQPAQPFYEEAKMYLSKMTKGRLATLRLLRLDQYSRAVASVSVKKWGFWPIDASLEMIKAGLATVYRGRDAEYGYLKEKYFAAEELAKKHRRGMWKQLTTGSYEDPADFKRRMRFSNP